MADTDRYPEVEHVEDLVPDFVNSLVLTEDRFVEHFGLSTTTGEDIHAELACSFLKSARQTFRSLVEQVVFTPKETPIEDRLWQLSGICREVRQARQEKLRQVFGLDLEDIDYPRQFEDPKETEDIIRNGANLDSISSAYGLEVVAEAVCVLDEHEAVTAFSEEEEQAMMNPVYTMTMLEPIKQIGIAITRWFTS